VFGIQTIVRRALFRAAPEKHELLNAQMDIEMFPGNNPMT
jgi:hypothetical protein